MRILVGSVEERTRARRILTRTGADLAAVDFYIVPTNRGWTRDYGPIFVKKGDAQDAGGVALTNWRFNAWAKYDDWPKDDAATKRLIPKLKLPFWEPVWQPLCGSRFQPRQKTGKSKAALAAGNAGKAPGSPGQGGTDRRRFPARIVLEGGSIDVNGLGTLLTTEECLLSKVQARNPGCTREDMEAIFRDYLGVTNTLWLGNGIAGDDTHGHVDDLARFVNAHHRRHRRRNRSLRSQFRAAAGQSRAPAPHERPGRPPAAHRDAAHARTGLLRWPAPPGQLRQFLHRQ